MITHAGLLIVIGGSWWAAQTSDEGQVGMREGETSSKLIRNHKPVVYVKPIDPHTGQPTGEYKLPFRPGSFDWPAGRYEVVSNAKDPFKLAIKKFYVGLDAPGRSSCPTPPARRWSRSAPRSTRPAARRSMDVFTSRGRPLVRHPAAGRPPGLPRTAGPAQFIFSYVDGPRSSTTSLNPPADPGKEGVARLLYERQGRQVPVRSRSGSTTPSPASRSRCPTAT